ncbi:MAG: alcohol dehydrogenase catalytic domain-containing protein [Deltaproteobacteria bacterium]|nr:alcohol dehydrogenase catalytic domain-containing protein [Deltaproteobacteria bacterium]
MTRRTAAHLDATGWAGALTVRADEHDLPAPVRDQLLVAVEACGVCHRDLIDREGRIRFLRLPIVPGHEASGRVLQVGPDTQGFSPGDRVATLHRDHCGVCDACLAGETTVCDRAASVLGLTIDGGYASHLLAPERVFYRVPDQLDAPTAAVLHCTLGTAWRGLVTQAGLRSGQHALITGANGGVGHAAVLLAKSLGATVTAVIRDDAHQDFVASLGADQILVDPGDTFHKRLGRRRADVVLDTVGATTFNASLRSLRVGGRLVTVGNIVDARVELNLGYIITFGIRVIGSSGASGADMEALLSWLGSHPIGLRIARTLELSRADEAQRLLRRGGLEGRVVLVP